MIASLRIRNLALVEELHWEPGTGFAAITGETGAGKSVILGALNLVLGERADKSLIRTGADICTVEATFQLPSPALAVLNPLLEDSGADPCASDGQLIIRRTLSLNGPARQFLNGAPTTQAVLKSIGDHLADLHGPHDHQSLHSPDHQLRLLDAYAATAPEVAAHQQAHAALARLRRDRDELAAATREQAREADRLRALAEELGAADLRPDEEEALDARYAAASSSRRLIELANGVAAAIAIGHESAQDRLRDTQRGLREIERLDPSAAEFLKRHASLLAELGEFASDLQSYADRLDLDPRQLAQMEDRVTRYATLKRKHRATLPMLAEMHRDALARLESLDNSDADLARLDREIATATKSLRALSLALRAKREPAATRLAADIARHLHKLGFKQAEFHVALSPLPEPRPDGLDAIEFLFAPNPGEPAKPLRAIASSGETSRVMLAVKSVLSRQDAIPLLVFDEIDANVGGEIAGAVGAQMRVLSEHHQVLCITHLPQVAALAHRHFHVQKTVRDDGRTVSLLTHVTGPERETELARMLGGQTPSALAHARTLLKGKQVASPQ